MDSRKEEEKGAEMKTWFDKKVLVGLALAAALTAPIASAKAPAKVTIPSKLSYIQAPGSVSDLARFEEFRGGPTGAYESQGLKVTIPRELSYIQAPGSVSDLARFEGFRGGPAGVTDVGIRYPATEPAPTGNAFDWTDAAVGAGFAAGIALLAAAGALALRRRRPLAQA
jgi:hypothetical protein